MAIKPIAQLRSAEQFGDYLAQLGVDLPFDAKLEHAPDSPLAQPYPLGAEGQAAPFTIGNRFCVQPMEGWDGTPDGYPTENTTRRWVNFGASGAKLVWGGEAVAVVHAGRANPNQLMIDAAHAEALRGLRDALVTEHERRYGRVDDLLVGLQLTHSGRYAKPNDKFRGEPVILYHHPILDRKMGLPADYPIMTDGEIEALIAAFIDAAELAYQAGFQFVDVKHCHGYLGHEFLSAVTRPGAYGGSFENRTRFLREVTAGIRARVPGLRIGVRLSAFDLVAFEPDPETNVGRPVMLAGAPFRFGGDPENPLEPSLDEPARFLALLQELGIQMVNLTGGSPYYNPHVQRPAFFPPSDGYLPPEDPLVGVARHVNFDSQLKQSAPGLLTVGTGYSYLQEWLAHVGQCAVRAGRVDFVGLGRMILSYPDFAADILAGRPLQRKRLCRTFSDCTTAPRKGLVSGCYPLDPYYKDSPQAEILIDAKKG